MHIVLLILKVIGIIILVLVLLLLALLLIVLCTPLRYRVRAEYDEGKPDVHAKAGIWFSALSVNASFTEEGLSVYLSIFGRRKKLITPEMRVPEEEKKPNSAADTAPMELEDEPLTETASSEPLGFAEDSEPVQEQYSVLPESEETPGEEHPPEPEKEPRKKTVRQRFGGASEKLKALRNKAQDLIRRLRKLYHSVKRKEQVVMWFWDKPSTKHMLAVFRKQLIKIVKSILPKKLTGSLRLGLEDPALMGQICMFGGMFYPMYEKHFSFTPIFGEKVIEGEVFFKGRIICGAILAHVLRILLTRDFYSFLRNVKILLRKLK